MRRNCLTRQKKRSTKFRHPRALFMAIISSYWSSLSINLRILTLRKRRDVNRFLHKLTAPSRLIVNTL